MSSLIPPPPPPRPPSPSPARAQPPSPPPSALAAGEHEAFHGRPAAGAALLGDLLADHPEPPRARWLLGVCLGALGRYAVAAAVLEPALSADSPAADSLAASARASHLRQLQRHAEAEELDRAAVLLALAGPPECREEALADALTGLVADAVGRYDLAAARTRLAEATAHVAGRPAAGALWRAPIRLAWVRAEVALLGGEPEVAARQAATAVRLSRAAAAPRHLAKSLLFRGVAEQVLGSPAAAATLDLAANSAADLGLLPLVWPARLVRSRILAEVEPEAARGEWAAADAAMRAIAAGLPDDESSALLTRTGRN
jgi:tetratricopeptide (TPR) repeat protein